MVYMTVGGREGSRRYVFDDMVLKQWWDRDRISFAVLGGFFRFRVSMCLEQIISLAFGQLYHRVDPYLRNHVSQRPLGHQAPLRPSAGHQD